MYQGRDAMKQCGFNMRLCAYALLFCAQSVFSLSPITIPSSSSSIGQSGAGDYSNHKEQSVGYLNPSAAGRTTNASISLVAKNIRNEFHLSSATDPLDQYITSAATHKSNTLAISPNIFTNLKINKWFGWSLNFVRPYAYEYKYNKDSAARFWGYNNKFNSFDLNNGFSLKLLDKLYVGISHHLYMARYNHSVFLLNATNNLTDYAFAMRGNAHGVGVGLTWHVSNKTTLGLVLNSKTTLKLKSTNNNLYNENTEMLLPAKITYSATSRINDEWVLLSDISFTNWSKLKKFRINYNEAATPRFVEHTVKARNSLGFSLGLNYFYNNFIIKFGAAFHKSPFKQDARMVSMPDADNLTIGIGANYSFSKNISIDCGYSYMLLRSADINQKGALTDRGQSVGYIHGKYKNSLNTLGVQLNLSLA